jgi:hypothetical protein
MTPIERRSYTQMYGALRKIVTIRPAPAKRLKDAPKLSFWDYQEAIEAAHSAVAEAEHGLRRVRKPATIQIAKGLNR